MMLVAKNALVKELATGRVFRVLDTVPSPDTKDPTATHYVLIALEDNNALPELMGRTKFGAKLANREWILIEEERTPLNLENLSEAERNRMNNRWNVMQIILRQGRAMYDHKFRDGMFKRMNAEGYGSRPWFYKIVRLYWQGGGGKESLATNFSNCGRPGVPRLATDDSAKPGRPRTVTPGKGVAVTEKIRLEILFALAHAPVGRDGKGLEAAYNWMLIRFYPDYVALAPGKALNVVIHNYDAVITFDQFKYHWKKEFSLEVRTLNRLQRRKFDQAFRHLLTGTLHEVRGPGTRYYIDATVLDVYIVSRRGAHRIIGRPTLYLVVDQFSRMIVGMYVGLEPPCWMGAMLALWNCCVDKVKFCARYGVEIEEDIWPTGHIPLHLMGDRGELTAEDAERLSAAFNLDVENAPPYRGDAKGVVERSFRTLQAKFGPYVPGYVEKQPEPGEEWPAFKAVLNIEEITRILIYAVIRANTRVVREYQGDLALVEDRVPFVPVELWKWGVENLRADFRQFKDDYLKIHLWPKTMVTATRRGLQFFKGLYYMGVDLQQQPWYFEALKKKLALQASYHPLDASRVVVAGPERTGVHDVELVRHSGIFKDLTYSEIAGTRKDTAELNGEAKFDYQPTHLHAEQQVHAGIKAAMKRAKNTDALSGSKAQRRKDIRKNRQEEMDDMAQEMLTALLGDPERKEPTEEIRSKSHEQTETTDMVKRQMQIRREEQSKRNEN